ncbi:cytidylate kinase [bacterium E08(2017)]|nr:cytidylate kinase [bacterium E08(2017)]
MNKVVAIDGPSASGKSTVARKTASGLGYLFVDSGSLYRGLTWKALEKGVDIDSEDEVSEMAENIVFEFFEKLGAVCFGIEGVEPVEELRTEEINSNVSRVATYPAVREKVVNSLRSMRDLGSLVIEGRDITTAVFPDAEYKFYLDASPEERARRRHAEMAVREDIAEEAVLDSLAKRDMIDSTREKDPLRVAEDAEIIDTTDMTLDEVVDYILVKIQG